MQSVFFYVLQTLMTNVDPKHVILCTCWDTPSDDTTFFETIIKSKPCLYDVLFSLYHVITEVELDSTPPHDVIYM